MSLARAAMLFARAGSCYVAAARLEEETARRGSGADDAVGGDPGTVDAGRRAEAAAGPDPRPTGQGRRERSRSPRSQAAAELEAIARLRGGPHYQTGRVPLPALHDLLAIWGTRHAGLVAPGASDTGAGGHGAEAGLGGADAWHGDSDPDRADDSDRDGTGAASSGELQHGAPPASRARDVDAADGVVAAPSAAPTASGWPFQGVWAAPEGHGEPHTAAPVTSVD